MYNKRLIKVLLIKFFLYLSLYLIAFENWLLILMLINIILYILLLIFDKRSILLIILDYFSFEKIKLINIYQQKYENIVLNDFSNVKSLKLNNIWSNLEQIYYFKPINRKYTLEIFEKLFNKFKKRKYIYNYDIIYIIKYICIFLKVPVKYLKINVIIKQDSTYLGTFVSKGTIGGEINIYLTPYLNFSHIFCVCLHETIHYFNHYNQIIFDENEELYVDASTIYFGFGKYVIEGYQSYTIFCNMYFENKKITKIGYLDVEELVYLEKKYML